MSGAIGQSGMVNGRDIGLRLQPLRNMERRRLMRLHPHRQGAQAAAREIGIVGRNSLTKLLRGVAQFRP